VVDGGGIEAVRRKLEQYEPWVDAVNATDNTAAHAHASNVVGRDRAAEARHGADPAGRLPRQEPARDPGRHRRAALHGVENISASPATT
jgi:methylenetetrahydrofolate reductase (NADPH)